jgi:F-type H+-transporting ATPase subunit a
MSAEQAINHVPTAGEYIRHHLENLRLDFSFRPAEQKGLVDFHVFNADSLFFSILLGVILCFVLWRIAKKATSGRPGRMQAAIELLMEFVENQAKTFIHSEENRKLISPLAFTVFIWIFFMNFMDMLPMDLIPGIWHGVAETTGAPNYMRVVPTADLSVTMGMALSVLLICFYYNIKVKGLAGWGHELITAPFGNKVFLYPINFLMQMLEFVAKTISHGMRLFGNMFAGELVFMLIALLGGTWAWQMNPLHGYFWLGIAQLFCGTIWTLFHILVISLQAFIFMMLTLIYVGQAHSKH